MRDYLATFTRSKIAARLIYFLSECFTSNVSILVKLSSYCIPLQIIISLIMILINLFEIETVMLTFILLINKYFELNKNQPSVLQYSINTQHQLINNLFLAMSTLSIFVSIDSQERNFAKISLIIINFRLRKNLFPRNTVTGFPSHTRVSARDASTRDKYTYRTVEDRFQSPLFAETRISYELSDSFRDQSFIVPWRKNVDNNGGYWSIFVRYTRIL